MNIIFTPPPSPNRQVTGVLFSDLLAVGVFVATKKGKSKKVFVAEVEIPLATLWMEDLGTLDPQTVKAGALCLSVCHR